MITVLIPAYNEEKLIEKCLLSLTQQTPAPDEILVVDNASTDTTPAIVADVIDRYPQHNIRMIHEERKGCHIARDTGWREATGDIIVHVDADETFPDGWMAEIHRQLEKSDPSVGAIGGAIRFENAPFVIWLTQVLYNLIYPRAISLAEGHPYLCGGMTICKREVLEKMDGYRHKPDDQLDDYYLSSQAHKLGYKLRYVPRIYAIHSLRRYEALGLKGWLRWGVAAMDTNLYDEDVR